MRLLQVSAAFSIAILVSGCGGSESKPSQTAAPAASASPSTEKKSTAKPKPAKKGALQSLDDELPGKDR